MLLLLLLLSATPLRIVTVDSTFPLPSIQCIFFSDLYHLQILSDCIHEPSVAWQFHGEHLSSNVLFLASFTCPNYLSLASLVLSPKHFTCAVPQMYSFLILSILVTPNENLNIFSSVTSNSASCFFVNAAISKPYNNDGLTTVLYTLPFTFAGTLLSQMTANTIDLAYMSTRTCSLTEGEKISF